jgi:hypothetical protein
MMQRNMWSQNSRLPTRLRMKEKCVKEVEGIVSGSAARKSFCNCALSGVVCVYLVVTTVMTTTMFG